MGGTSSTKRSRITSPQLRHFDRRGTAERIKIEIGFGLSGEQCVKSPSGEEGSRKAYASVHVELE